MGNCFSDPSKEGGQRLGSAPSSSPAVGGSQPPSGPAGGAASAAGRGRTLSGSGQATGGSAPGQDPRAAAAAAADARAQAVSEEWTPD